MKNHYLPAFLITVATHTAMFFWLTFDANTRLLLERRSIVSVNLVQKLIETDPQPIVQEPEHKIGRKPKATATEKKVSLRKKTQKTPVEFSEPASPSVPSAPSSTVEKNDAHDGVTTEQRPQPSDISSPFPKIKIPPELTGQNFFPRGYDAHFDVEWKNGRVVKVTFSQLLPHDEAMAFLDLKLLKAFRENGLAKVPINTIEKYIQDISLSKEIFSKRERVVFTGHKIFTLALEFVE